LKISLTQKNEIGFAMEFSIFCDEFMEPNEVPGSVSFFILNYLNENFLFQYFNELFHKYPEKDVPDVVLVFKQMKANDNVRETFEANRDLIGTRLFHAFCKKDFKEKECKKQIINNNRKIYKKGER